MTNSGWRQKAGYGATGEHVGAEMNNLLEEENLGQTSSLLPPTPSPAVSSAGVITMANWAPHLKYEGSH